jgi:hypothetical protein
MTKLQIIGKTGNQAVQKLRIQKLRNGSTFMINSKELGANQCYLELPNGSIQLVFLKNAAKNFTVIRTLSHSEEGLIRSKYGFSRL